MNPSDFLSWENAWLLAVMLAGLACYKGLQWFYTKYLNVPHNELWVGAGKMSTAARKACLETFGRVGSIGTSAKQITTNALMIARGSAGLFNATVAIVADLGQAPLCGLIAGALCALTALCYAGGLVYAACCASKDAAVFMSFIELTPSHAQRVPGSGPKTAAPAAAPGAAPAAVPGAAPAAAPAAVPGAP